MVYIFQYLVVLLVWISIYQNSDTNKKEFMKVQDWNENWDYNEFMEVIWLFEDISE